MQLAVNAPAFTLQQNGLQCCALRRGFDACLQQNFVHDPATEGNFSSGVYFGFFALVNIGKISCRGTDIDHQNGM